MRQEAFERGRAERWSRFELALRALEKGRPAAPDFPRSYRLLCQDLALARDRGFGAPLVDRLNSMALRGHQILYGAGVDRARPIEFLARRFPAAVRREARLLTAMSLLFYGSALAVFLLDLRNPDLVYHLMSPAQVSEFESMYDPEAPHYGTPRATSGDVSAFAYYVRNNVGVAFRTFAWGLFAGVGSVVVLLLNGLILGLLAAHLTLEGYAETFFSFVIGHGAFELTAIVLSGVCGAKLGWTLVAPGEHGRGHALRRAGRETVPLLYGVVALLLVAAVVEAFWSSSRALPATAKLATGAGAWLAVIAWLALAGRARGD